MDPPIEGVDGGSDPPLAYSLRAPPRAADPAEDMQAMQREPGGAQPRDERPADAHLTGSGIAAPAAPEPLDTTSTKLEEPPEVNTGNSRRSSSPSESGPASAAPRDKNLTFNTTEQLLAQAARTLAQEVSSDDEDLRSDLPEVPFSDATGREAATDTQTPVVTITDPSKWNIGTPNALEATQPRENLQPGRILRRSPKNSASSSTSPRALSDDKNRGGEGLIYSTPLQAGDILPLDVFGPEGSKRATSGDSVEDPSHAGARSQTGRGTPVGEAEMNPADNVSHLRTQLGGGVPEKLTLMQEPDDKHKKVNSHHSKEIGESSAALSPLPSDDAEPGTTSPPRNSQGKKVMQSQDDVGASTLWNLTEAVAGGPEQFWLQINEEISRINYAIAEFSADRASTHASAAIIELSAAFEKINCQLGSAEEEAVNLKAAAKTAIAELRALYDELVAENDILRQEIEEREKRAQDQLAEELNRIEVEYDQQISQIQAANQEELSRAKDLHDIDSQRHLDLIEASHREINHRANVEVEKLQVRLSKMTTRETERKAKARDEAQASASRAEEEESSTSGGISFKRLSSLKVTPEEARESMLDEIASLEERLELSNTQRAETLGNLQGAKEMAASVAATFRLREEMLEQKCLERIHKVKAERDGARKLLREAINAGSPLDGGVSASSPSMTPQALVEIVKQRDDAVKGQKDLHAELEEAKASELKAQENISRADQKAQARIGSLNKAHEQTQHQLRAAMGEARTAMMAQQAAQGDLQTDRDRGRQVTTAGYGGRQGVCHDPDHEHYDRDLAHLRCQLATASDAAKGSRVEIDKMKKHLSRVTQDHDTIIQTQREERSRAQSAEAKQRNRVEVLTSQIASYEKEIAAVYAAHEVKVTPISEHEHLLKSALEATNKANQENIGLEEQRAALAEQLETARVELAHFNTKLPSSQLLLLPVSSHGFDFPSGDTGEILAVHGPSAATSTLTQSREVMWTMMMANRCSFCMIFSYDEIRPHRDNATGTTDKQRAVNAAMQFCNQPRFSDNAVSRILVADNALEPAWGADTIDDHWFAVHQGLITGITLSSEAARIASRPAVELGNEIHRLGQQGRATPGAKPYATHVEVETAVRTFSDERYAHLYGPRHGPSYLDMPQPLWPEWVQSRASIQIRLFAQVTAWYFRRCVSTGDITWPLMLGSVIAPTGEPDPAVITSSAEEQRQQRRSAFLRSGPGVNSTRPGGDPASPTSAPLETQAQFAPGPRIPASVTVAPVLRANGSHDPACPQCGKPSFGGETCAECRYEPRSDTETSRPSLKASKRTSKSQATSQSRAKSPKSSGDGDSDSSSNADGGHTPSMGYQSEQEVYDEGKRSAMTASQYHRLKCDTKISRPHQLRKALETLNTAKWNPSVVEHNSLARSIKAAKHPRGSNAFRKSLAKLRISDHADFQKNLTSVLRTYKPKTASGDSGTKPEREEWWQSQNGRTQLQRAFNMGVSSYMQWTDILESLSRAIQEIKSASWMRQLIELFQEVNSISSYTHLAVEMFLFVCDFTADPSSSSIDRDQAKWDSMSPGASLVETAQLFENLGGRMLKTHQFEMYTKDQEADLLLKRFAKLYADSEAVEHQILGMWLSSKLEDIMQKQPSPGAWDSPDLRDLGKKEKNHQVWYMHRSVLRIAEAEGVMQEALAKQHAAREKPRAAEPKPQRQPKVPSLSSVPTAAALAVLQQAGPTLPDFGTVASIVSTGDTDRFGSWGSGKGKGKGKPASITPGGKGSRGVGFLGNQGQRPVGQGIVMEGYWEKHPFLHDNYPGGKEAFESIPISTKARDTLFKLADTHDDKRVKFILGVVFPYKAKEDFNEPFQCRYGPSHNDANVSNGRYIAGACPLCSKGMTCPSKDKNNPSGCVYRLDDPADSAHDAADCPRVKAALCYWSLEMNKEDGMPAAYRDCAVLKRLMYRHPKSHKLQTSGRLMCEEASQTDVMAAEEKRPS